MTTYWYRVDETTYSAGVNEWGDVIPGGPTRTNLRCVAVRKETRCGVWVDDYSRLRFVNRAWRKRFACPTIEEAIASFKARKAAQIRIARARIAQAEEAMRYLDNTGFYFDERKWL